MVGVIRLAEIKEMTGLRGVSVLSVLVGHRP